jgi:hypothetical protein
MKDEWYGDRRDLVKWGTLLELARRYECKHILQVLYARKSTYGTITVAGEEIPLQNSIIRHFRNLASVESIATHPSIEVVADLLERRAKYHEIVIQRVLARRHSPGIVFLDPDTGLEPQKPGPQHVLESELLDIWGNLRKRDLLVFYQHQTNRNGSPWIEAKMEQFERAIGVRRGEANLAHAPTIASDVAFFFAEKTS